MLEFRILGPLEVLADGEPMSLPRKKQRALLALLLLRAGEVVSTDELIEELWAGKPPATARDALQNYVSQLRKALGPEVIVTRDPGYALEATAEQTDLSRFERLVAEARGEDAKARAAKLREALGLWRGPPLADLAYEAFTGLEMARLEELRASAQADLVDAELELGRHAELVPELETTIAERPFDERPRAQLMLALYRSGRQADALGAYSHARRTLDEELGLEPGAQLRELEQAILRQDAALEAPLAAPVGLEERRKTVTILFADLVESTELAEALDPESLRRVLDGYFAAARRAIEGHGGTIEKFIGDAVMAVFGVPVAHEDDALRAVRAGVDTRTAVAALSEAVEREHGLRLDLRIGINTGDVYVGDPGHGGLVTGNAVTVAKRIEQAAPSGAIMLSVGTLELVRDAVHVKAVRPRKEKPLPAFRLLELIAGAPSVARYLEAELVGREDELRRLLAVFDVAKREPPSQVFTVVGEPGIGKTRLANELIALVESDSTVLTGRCISYGEGATYLPLREMVEGLDLATVLAEADDAELVTQRVLELVGLAEGTAPAGEGAWATRRLFEALAGERPLLLVFEDIQWAEPTLLDLIEQLAEHATGPILAVCIARPELLEERPSWGERALVLEPLANEESVALLASLPGGDELTAEARQRIVDVTAGNPLFAEQFFAYVDERGSAALDDVPPSVEALLESRLDLLAGDERTLLQRAGVIGREFTLRALVDLSPADAAAALPSHLFELVRKGLIRPARAPAGEEAFRFHHVLVRDVAYNGLPRADRARLHERLADWLAGEADPLDEIVGYHLEQAYRNRAELGPPNRRARQLAADAGARLGAAGMRSWRSGDVPATVNLLGRATSLLPENEPWRRELLCELGVAFDAAGDTARAEETLSGAVTSAEAAMDARNGYRARLELARVGLRRDPEGQDEALLEVAEKAIPAFEEVGDDRGLSRAWLLSGWVQGGVHGQHAAWEGATERALVHYRRSGFPGSACLGSLCAALYYGPAPVQRAIARCHELLDTEDPNRFGEANVLRYLGGLVAMGGEVGEGRELVERAEQQFDELGQIGAAKFCSGFLGDIAFLAGDFEATEQARQALCAYCEASHDFGALCTAEADLAEVIYQLRDYDEAGRWSLRSEEHAGSNDIGAQCAWRAVRAKVLARRGMLGEAEALAQEAVALAAPTDNLNRHAYVLLSLAEVLHLIERPNDADEAVAQGLALYVQKGNVAAAERATGGSEARGPSRSLSS